jgi:murein L,D-transpeptidase YafK
MVGPLLVLLLLAGAGQGIQPGVPANSRTIRAEQAASVRLRPLLNAQSLALGAPVCLRVFKEERVLEVWLRTDAGQFRLLKSYPICTFSGGLGPKLARGDGQSPEGFYSVRPGAMNPASRYHLSFDVGYPNAYDRAKGRTGSALMVHGACVSIGCYAMTDPTIEEIWTVMAAAFRNGQREIPVQLLPFRMSVESLARHRSDPWYDFWGDLKTGYDLFENARVPPRVEVRDGRYRFTAAPGLRP